MSVLSNFTLDFIELHRFPICPIRPLLLRNSQLVHPNTTGRTHREIALQVREQNMNSNCRHRKRQDSICELIVDK